jgi:hypothetical protein
MTFLAKLDLTVSQIRPLWFLLIYLIAIPAFGLLYVFVTPHGFYAPYERYEAEATSDTTKLEAMLEAAIRRSFNHRVGEEFVVGTSRLDLDRLRDSLRVDNAQSTDGTTLSFRVRFTANDIVDFEGERQLGWSIVVTIPELPTSAALGSSSVIVYRFPEVDFSKYASPFREQTEKLFGFIFGQGNYGFGISAPAVALSYQEDLQLRRYLQGVRGDPLAFSGDVWRMVYLSADVITTLGLGDIVPTTWPARSLVASEAVAGIVLAGLFLNALAYRASGRRA